MRIRRSTRTTRSPSTPGTRSTCAADEHGRDWATPYRLEELRVRPAGRRRRGVGWPRAPASADAGAAVAAGRLETPLLDNLSAAAWIQVHTRPDCARPGPRVGDAGAPWRSRPPTAAAPSCTGEAAVEVRRGRDGTGRPGGGVAGTTRLPARRWWTCSVTSGCPSPRARAGRAGGRGGAAPCGVHAQLVGRARCPTRSSTASWRWSPRCASRRPRASCTWSPSPPTWSTSGTGEATLARQGRTKYNTVALAAPPARWPPTPIIVSVRASRTARAFQWGTLVRPADRGHRLGLAVKVGQPRSSCSGPRAPT